MLDSRDDPIRSPPPPSSRGFGVGDCTSHAGQLFLKTWNSDARHETTGCGIFPRSAQNPTAKTRRKAEEGIIRLRALIHASIIVQAGTCGATISLTVWQYVAISKPVQFYTHLVHAIKLDSESQRRMDLLLGAACGFL